MLRGLWMSIDKLLGGREELKYDMQWRARVWVKFPGNEEPTQLLPPIHPVRIEGRGGARGPGGGGVGFCLYSYQERAKTRLEKSGEA